MKRHWLEIFKTATASVLVLFCGFQIFRMLEAFVAREPVTNPLGPQYLETGIRNYIIFFTVIYALVAVANVWSWYQKKSFYATTIVSFAIIVGIQLCYAPIVYFFLNHPLP
ncbi:MAG TPA: hypothetical protein PLS51_13810 [Flavobacterium sp.]|nr:hypothetical protein [Flavobacterium sp.]